MDIMKINSAFTTGLISKIISHEVRKKLGRDVNVSLRTVEVTISEENQTQIHVDATVGIEGKDLLGLLKISGN